MFKNIFFLLLINPVISFKSAVHKTNNQKLFNINPMQYKNSLEKASIGELVKNIDNDMVDKIFFTQDLKNSYNRFDKNGDGIYDIEDYSITYTAPEISNLIIEHADNSGVDCVILEPPFDPLKNVLLGMYEVVNFFFLPIITFMTIRMLFFSNAPSPMNPMGGSNTNNFSPFKNNNINSDKENMIKSNISLSSWAGSPEIFQECTEIVTYLNNRTLYESAGAQIPRGILLEGPPGTGKTLLAKAIASECDANFISVAASEFVELFVGMGAAKVRNLFKKARDNSPSIIFIDEIDAVGKQRGTGINAGNDEREQTLNQILAEMDGFSQNDNVIVIAATNRRDVLDNALLRPGRFDRIVNVPLPDKPSRLSIFNVHLQNKTIEDNIDLNYFSEMTAGFSGAQIKNLINEAAINAVREFKTTISQKNIVDALQKLSVGIVKINDTRSDDAIRRVAYHEIGHAYLAALFNNYFQLKQVSIQSTYNGAGGFTIFSEYPDIIESGLYTKDILKKRIIIALGGKAAEYVFYGEENVSLGASNDLKQANSLAKQMIGNYGMGNALKTFYNENTDTGRNPFLGRSLATNDGIYSEEIKKTFDKETRFIVDEAYKQAVNIIYNNQHKINTLVNILIKSTNMDGELITNYIHPISENDGTNCDANHDSY